MGNYVNRLGFCFFIACLTIPVNTDLVNWWEYAFVSAARMVLKNSSTVAFFNMNFSTPVRMSARIRVSDGEARCPREPGGVAWRFSGEPDCAGEWRMRVRAFFGKQIPGIEW